jgi:hypothetical protein
MGVHKSSQLATKIAHMALPLAPLVQLTTGLIHPAFPRTLLNYYLLVESELDDMAHFYHQCTPCEWTFHYPKTMNWRSGLTLEEKRRKLGNFIGLRGCDSPILVKTEEMIWEEARRDRDDQESWRRKMGF